MNLILAFKSRIARPLQQRYFEYSKYGPKIKKYNNKFNNKRCFIVANGPSLRTEDLDILHERGEITFGMNRIYKLFSETKWHPAFNVIIDPTARDYFCERYDSDIQDIVVHDMGNNTRAYIDAKNIVRKPAKLQSIMQLAVAN